MNPAPSWLARAIRIIVVASWVALALGVLGSATTEGQPPELSVAAAVLSGGLVTALIFLPRGRLMEKGLVLELLVVAGAVLTVASTTLTGGVSSPYLLMALLPCLLAAITGGHRMGITTALLSSGLLAAVETATGGVEALVAAAGTIALFPLLAVVVAQIRSILVDIEARASSFEKASEAAEAELARLGQAHDLLRRLTDVYGEGSSNPVDVGRSALEAIVDSHPGSFATATLFDTRGPVVVARLGSDSPDLVRTRFPLGDDETTSGVVSLGTAAPLSTEQHRDIERLLRPVAVAFANAVLLQNIAEAAVREERLRLARELHDEVGPALAALGLSLDATAMEAGDPDLQRNIGQVREGLGRAVDDLRGIIADLRSEGVGSFASELQKMASALSPPPVIDVAVQEQRAPRATAGRQILAIVTESVRNAHHHADASRVTVTGSIDRGHVELEVADDGTGFDPGRLPEGHYGIMGMRERADRIGATVELRSGTAGTTVRIIWKERR